MIPAAAPSAVSYSTIIQAHCHRWVVWLSFLLTVNFVVETYNLEGLSQQAACLVPASGMEGSALP